MFLPDEKHRRLYFEEKVVSQLVGSGQGQKQRRDLQLKHPRPPE